MVTSYFTFWFSCMRRQDRILETTNIFKISLTTYFLSEHIKRPSESVMSNFEAPSSFFFLKNVRLWIHQHTYEILEKTLGRHFGQTWRVQRLPFSLGDPWGRRYQLFSNQNFSGHVPTKFRIQCDFLSSNQTGAIPTATFQNWVSAK